LLYDYKEPQRSQILDYLFTPNYGASLHILKVEIGGDSQSTDGTEPSHMHSADDLDYHRGYEWWLLQEAKKRNPEIKTYGLPWAFPGWVGGPEQSGDPFKHPELTSKYMVKWLEGARSEYGVEIDYLGIWNERASDATYAKTLRKVLDESGFKNTTLVAKDGGSDICDEMAKDPGYVDAIGVVGLHYPSDFDDYSNCRKLGYGLSGKRGGKPIWSSEESSSHDDLNGAACWARIIMSHWVLQGMTASIMWNLVGAYFHGTNWDASSLLTAKEPWSGHYDHFGPVWATAHTTQFTQVGWDLIEVGSGSGQLPAGGFYATYADPKTGDWTLTISKIDRDHASCTRPALPDFHVQAENVTFRLASSVKRSTLALWYSNFEDYRPDGQVPTLFQRLDDVEIKDDLITLEVKVGAVITVSTIVKGPTKGAPPTPIPESQPSLPLPFFDDFESYEISKEGKYWSDQIGSFEVHYESGASGNKVMRQMVPELPIGWGDGGSYGPVTLNGMREWQDLTVTVQFKLPEAAAQTGGGCVATRASQMWADGITLCVFGNGRWFLAEGGPKLGGKPAGALLTSGTLPKPLPSDKFSTISLTTIGSIAWAKLDGQVLFSGVQIPDVDTGFAIVGATDWFAIQLDNVRIEPAGPRWSPPVSPCPAAAVGMPLQLRPCASNGLAVDDQVFELLPDWGIFHKPSGLCATAPNASTGAGVVLAKCDPNDVKQQFVNDYTLIRDNLQPISLRAGGGKLHLAGDLHGNLFLESCASSDSGTWHKWSYFPNTRQLRNEYTAIKALGYPMCMALCKEPSRTREELVI